MAHFGFQIETVVVFFAVVGFSVFMDLIAHRKTKEISVPDASLWSTLWIGLAVAFYGYVWVHCDRQWADLSLVGLTLEKSLFVDNLMIFMAVFAALGLRSLDFLLATPTHFLNGTGSVLPHRHHHPHPSHHPSGHPA